MITRKFITCIEPYDPRIADEVNGHGIGFPHVGMKKIAESMGYGQPGTYFGFNNIFSNTLKAWNGTPLQLGWVIEVGTQEASNG